MPRPVVALYVVGDGQPCSARIVVRQGQRQGLGRLLLRVLDPDERPVFWRYVEYTDAETARELGVHGDVELRTRGERIAEGETLLEAPIELRAPGVHQIRVSSGSHDIQVELDLERDLRYGLCFQNGDFRPWPRQPQTMYAFVPPHAEELRLRGGPLILRDDAGAELARHAEKEDETTVAVARTGVVWRFEFPRAGDWSFRAGGFPLILCPTEGAARAIRASVEVLPDGTVVCHEFQRRIAELLPRILAPERVGRTEELVTPLASRREAWLQDPIRSAVLTQAFLPMMEQWLNRQNLDPASHWGGSLDGWQDKINAAPPANRWDRLRGVEGLWAGASSHYGAGAAHLALAATYDSPVNPYHGRRELLYRAAGAALRDLMVLAEDETWPGIADLDPYPGAMAFALGQKTMPVYGLAAPQLPEEVREVWTEGLRRIVDRSFPDDLVSCRNQSSHYLVAFQAFADGSGDPLYRDLARLYARRFVAGQHPAGYHMEAIGPCSSYIGMTHWHEAVYYRMSGDPAMLESLRRSYRLFNHTVAPEPDGRMLGGFNFNHRVGEGFYFEQWGGAKGILDDVLPEVGVWAGPKPTRQERQAKRREAVEKVNAFLDDPRVPPYPDHNTWRYLCFAEPDRSGVFPCQEPDSFVRSFADEFLAVKRPAYYAVCYLGKPAGEYYIRAREELRLPLPDEAESAGGFLPDAKRITPFVGGGLSGFWTPSYGHALMAANWSPTTHHGLVATQADGRRYWEDYHAHEHRLDADAGELTVTGRVEGHPLAYQRRYAFEDAALVVDLTLTAEQDVALADLVENIPVARGGWKSRGADIVAGGQGEGEVAAASFSIVDQTGAGVEVRLDGTRQLRLVPNGLQTSGWRKLQIGRVEIALRASLKAGEALRLSYELRPLPPA